MPAPITPAPMTTASWMGIAVPAAAGRLLASSRLKKRSINRAESRLLMSSATASRSSRRPSSISPCTACVTTSMALVTEGYSPRVLASAFVSPMRPMIGEKRFSNLKRGWGRFSRARRRASVSRCSTATTWLTRPACFAAIGVEQFATGDEIERLAHANEARQPRGAAPGGQNAELCFRQAYLCRLG
jgi:hypothetical protein